MSRRGNYWGAVELIAEQVARQPGGAVVLVKIAHDDDCAHWRGRPCDCPPAVVAQAEPEDRRCE